MRLRTCYRGGDVNERAGWWLGFAYDEATVELIKRRIPHTHRVWSRDSGLWWVHDDYEAVIAEAFVNFATFRDQPALL